MCRLLFACLAYLFISYSAFAQEQFIVDVPAGDIVGLSEAIETANQRSPAQLTIILTTGDYHFTQKDLLPSIKGSMAIRGPARFVGDPRSPATFLDEGFGPQQLIHVEAGASLRLDNVELVDFSLRKKAGGLIENEGELHVKQVQLSSVHTVRQCLRVGCTPAMPAFRNRSSGQLHLDQVSVVESGVFAVINGYSGGVLANEGSAILTSVQVYQSKHSYGSPLLNWGSLKVHSSSFVTHRYITTSSHSLLDTRSEGHSEFLNSVVSGYSDDVCLAAISIGYNLHASPTCEWDSEGDLTGQPAGLLWRPVQGNWDWDGGQILTHALVPLAASPLIDSANSDWCNMKDLLNLRRIDGNGDGVRDCDRGAVEAPNIGLAEGGVNGLYFNPEADGHYLYILETDFTTLVVWTTFDSDGNQAWVYGTGELVKGRSIIAETYINRNGGYSLDGEFTPSEADYWGRIEIDMTSCTEGLVSFYSDLPGFGNGQFPVERLAYVKQLGCND